MATLYENHIVNDDHTANIFGVNWEGMTFTPSISHTITSVKLLLFRVGSPGTLTVSIRATAGGLPTGPDLASGTTNGNTLPTGAPYEWREITFGAGVDLASGTKYVICIRAASGAPGNHVNIRMDTGGGAYAGGNRVFSSDSGSSWTEVSSPAYDTLFEDWGDLIITFVPQVVMF